MAEAGPPRLRCSVCGALTPVDGSRWRCGCGGPFELDFHPPPLRPPLPPGPPWDLRRYRDQLPCPADALDRLTLGEGLTPLLAPDDRLGAPAGLLLKCDHTLPTGSFKDRGSVVLVAAAWASGAQRLVIDSSGNAGSSVAAYAARAGLPCEVYLPTAASAGKVRQIRGFGAVVHPVDGTREQVAAQAQLAAEAPGTWYASHVADPHFVHGTKTWAYEVWEQTGGVPDLVVLPVGNGSLLLGLLLGFGELRAAGLTERVPRVLAVQVAGFAPLAGDAAGGRLSVAEGIAIARPARLVQLREALHACGGAAMIVDDRAVLAATAQLAGGGFWVEPTAAAAWAAVRAGHPLLDRSACVVVALGGAGWKTAG